MKYKNYYEALGIPRDADPEQIKKAYRKLARQYHPDVSKEADAEQRFKEVGEAYATLKDPEKRAAYDALGSRPAGEEFTPPPQWNQDFSHASQYGQGFDEMDLSDLFAAFGHQRGGGGGRGAYATRPIAGQDYELSTQIGLEQAYKGTKLNLELDSGEGPSSLEITVPPGTTDGQKLRLRGRGGKGRNGGADGDIYLHISLTPHPVFRVDQADIYFDLALSPWEAALGAEIEVATLDDPVLLTVPAGSSTNRKLRLRGRGLSKGREGRGDLYAVVRIDVPKTLSERERELFQELARSSHFHPRHPNRHGGAA